jgi:hypothetical protein
VTNSISNDVGDPFASVLSIGTPAVDSIVVNGATAPGQWVLQPGYKEFGWQIQQGFALSGATVFPKGDELMVAPFLIKLWDMAFPAQYQAFVQFRSLYLKKAVFGLPGGLGAYALGISHPELNALGGTSWVVKKVPWLTNNGKGLWTGTCEFLQYRKPQPALNKPNATIPGAAKAVPKAADALQQQILDNAAKIAAARG